MEIKRKKDVGRIRIVEHNRVLGWIILFLIACLIVTVIAIKMIGDSENSSDNTQLANPASVYCLENGGNISLRTDANGGQYSVCILNNGTECDEWKYYRGEC